MAWNPENIWIFSPQTDPEEMVETLGTSPGACPFFDAKQEETLDLVDKFEFAVPDTHPRAAGLKNGMIAVVEDIDGHYIPYRIQRSAKINGEDAKRSFYCEHLAVFELNAAFVIERSSQNIRDAMIDALRPSLWEIGNIEGTFDDQFIEFYKLSSMECLQELAEKYGAEFKFRIEHDGQKITRRYVDVYARRGADNGVRLEANINMRSLEFEEDSTEIVTALYGYGKGEQVGDGYGRRIDFGEIEWSVENGDPVDKPKGQTWVGDPEALAIWGLKGGTVHLFGKVEFEQIEDKAELLQATWDALQQAKVPKTEYRVKVVDLEARDDMGHFAVRVGDTVTVIDDDMSPPVEFKARVLKVIRYPNEPEKTELEIGQRLMDSADVSRNLQYDLDRTVKHGDPLNWLDATVQTLTDELHTTPGYTYINPTDGILVTNAPKGEATSAIQLKGGMLAIADEWDENADDFNWRAFGTGDGFTADMLTTGTLNADLVKVLSDDGKTRMEIDSGRVFSYYEDKVTMSAGGYSIRIYDHGSYATNPDYGMLGVIASQWLSRPEDPEGVFNDRGIGFHTAKDWISIGKANYQTANFYQADNLIYANFRDPYTYFVGPATDSPDEYTQMIISGNRYPWNQGDDIFEMPLIRVHSGDFYGDGSLQIAGVQVYVGNTESDKDTLDAFQVYHRHTKGGSSDMVFGVYPQDEDIWLGKRGARINTSYNSTDNSAVRIYADSNTYMYIGGAGGRYHWRMGNPDGSGTIVVMTLEPSGLGARLRVRDSNGDWQTVV